MKLKNILKKSVIALCTCTVAFSFAITAMAAPASLKPSANDNSDNLIYIKKPSKLYASTSDSSYTITASGKKSTVVYVYRKSSVDNNFYRVYNGGNLPSGTIGASGLHTITVSLEEGSNNFLVRAEYGEKSVQHVKIDITRLTKSQLDKLDKISADDTFNLFNLK